MDALEEPPSHGPIDDPITIDDDIAQDLTNNDELMQSLRREEIEDNAREIDRLLLDERVPSSP